jgi:hypothetical protein
MRQKCARFWEERPEEKVHLEDQGVDRTGSELILGKLAGGFCSGFIWLRI